LAHRIVRDYQAKAKKVSAVQVIEKILSAVSTVPNNIPNGVSID
jgi:hypothetical protein